MEITSRINQLAEETAQALQGEQVPRETLREALTFMGEFLPKLDNYSEDIRLAVLGIACFNAGANSRGGAEA